MGKGVKGFETGNRCGVRNRFSTVKQPIKRGKKPALYKSALKLTDDLISKQDFVNIIRYLWEQPMSEILKIKDEAEKPDSEIPVWVYVFIRAMLSEMKRGKTNLFRYSLDFAFGKAPEKVEVNNNIHLVNNSISIALGNLPNDELLHINALINELNTLLTKAGEKEYLVDLESFKSGVIR